MQPSSTGHSWPAWNNQRIELFHGTIRPSAQNIISQGVNLSWCESNKDFGVGFYTTISCEQAILFSKMKSQKLKEPAKVVRLTLDRELLGSLTTIAFLRGSLDYTDFWSFVAHCRAGLSHQPASQELYDVVYGPVAKAWNGPNDSRTWEGYDQISFHTEAAVTLLNHS